MIRRCLFFFQFVLFFVTAEARDFITKWRFTAPATTISFGAQTTSAGVSYTWSASPSGNTGSGVFTRTILGPVMLSINAASGDVITVSMQSANLQMINTYGIPDQVKLIDISQWGDVLWRDQGLNFNGCANLDVTATDKPNLTNITRMDGMFQGCESLTGPANIGEWDMSNIVDINSMFSGAISFNQDISGWDVRKVTNLAYTFSGAATFNQPIGSWQLESCIYSPGTFLGAKAFNQDIGNWDMSKVHSMNAMFQDADAFNQDISAWNTGNVEDMASMFFGADAFNQDISGWNISKIVFMRAMFLNATSFNQDLSSWDVRHISYMGNLFMNASSFNQNLGSWVLSPGVDLAHLFSNTAMSCENYSKTLIGWATNNPNVTGRSLGATGCTYGPAAVLYRDQLLNQGWTISNDTYDAGCTVVLPVTFGDITAYMNRSNLEVHFTTLSETNNDHFEIEASADGKQFVSIGQLKSQAPNGKAGQMLNYSFVKDTAAAYGWLGLTIVGLALAGFVAGRKRKIIGFCMMTGLLLLVVVACNKNDAAVSNIDSQDLYIRIKQVDKDGSFKYSKVVKAVKK